MSVHADYVGADQIPPPSSNPDCSPGLRRTGADAIDSLAPADLPLIRDRKCAEAQRTKAATLAGNGLCSIRSFYFWMWYSRSPLSFFVDSICRLCFLAALDRKPRTLCACQPVVFLISARVAPFGRPINARIWAPLL